MVDSSDTINSPIIENCNTAVGVPPPWNKMNTPYMLFDSLSGVEKQNWEKRMADIDATRIYCDICHVITNSLDQYQYHLNGEKHRKQKESKTLFTGDDSLEEIEYNFEIKTYKCKICDEVVLNSSFSIKQHLNGKLHKKNKALKQKNLEPE